MLKIGYSVPYGNHPNERPATAAHRPVAFVNLEEERRFGAGTAEALVRLLLPAPAASAPARFAVDAFLGDTVRGFGTGLRVRAFSLFALRAGG